MATKTTCAIIIGDEILTGRTQDVNLNYMGKRLLGIGLRLNHARVVPDKPEEIIRHVNECRAAYDYVFTTGGIGPTHDDITAKNIAKAFGVKLELNAKARALLAHHYGSEKELNEARLRMAMIPEGAELIDNPVSAAPGFKLGNVYVMAGVPRIMQAMFDGILPTLVGGLPIHTRTVRCFLPESKVAEGLGKIAARYPEMEIGSYPYFRAGGYGLSLVARGTNAARLDAVAKELSALIVNLGGEALAGEESAAPAPDTKSPPRR